MLYNEVLCCVRWLLNNLQNQDEKNQSQTLLRASEPQHNRNEEVASNVTSLIRPRRTPSAVSLPV